MTGHEQDELTRALGEVAANGLSSREGGTHDCTLMATAIDVNSHCDGSPLPLCHTMSDDIVIDVESVAKRIRRAADARGIGVNAIDRKLGRKNGYTSNMITNDKEPKARTAAKIARALDVPLEWLVEEASGDPVPSAPTQANRVEPDPSALETMRLQAEALAGLRLRVAELESELREARAHAVSQSIVERGKLAGKRPSAIRVKKGSEPLP